MKNRYNKKGNQDGYWEKYRSDGKVIFNGKSEDSNLDDYWEYHYFSSEELSSKGNYKYDKKHGYWEEYHYFNGNLTKEFYI